MIDGFGNEWKGRKSGHAGAALLSCGLTLLAVSATPARAQTIDCSMYGSGYVAVQGTTRCVQIRGRMRVEHGASGYNATHFLPPSGAHPVTLPQAAPPQAQFRQWTR